MFFFSKEAKCNVQLTISRKRGLTIIGNMIKENVKLGQWQFKYYIGSLSFRGFLNAYKDTVKSSRVRAMIKIADAFLQDLKTSK